MLNECYYTLTHTHRYTHTQTHTQTHTHSHTTHQTHTHIHTHTHTHKHTHTHTHTHTYTHTDIIVTFHSLAHVCGMEQNVPHSLHFIPQFSNPPIWAYCNIAKNLAVLAWYPGHPILDLAITLHVRKLPEVIERT